MAQWLEEEKSEFDRALSSINDLTVGHQLLSDSDSDFFCGSQAALSYFS